MGRWSCDFETNTGEELVEKHPVWLWCAEELDSGDVARGWSIGKFFKWADSLHGRQLFYFHNLGFDGCFILSWLLRNGYKCVEYLDGKRSLRGKAFTCLRSKGKLYQIEICLNHTTVTIWDSYKLIPLGVARMPKAFGLSDICKGEIDYELPRDETYRPTDEEVDYIDRDVGIVARSLVKLYELGVSSDYMTISRDAYEDWAGRFKSKYGEDAFEFAFETYTDDEWLLAQEAYRGGICIVNPDVKGKWVGHGCVLDRNSMYPSVMMECPLPFGPGTSFDGKPPEGRFWIANLLAKFTLKDGQQAIFRPPHYPQYWPMGKMMEDTGSAGIPFVNVTLTSVDFDVLSEHYDIEVVKWVRGYAYMTADFLFEDYIGYWYSVKQHAAETGNSALKTIAKQKLNSLYGKFGQAPNEVSDVPYLDMWGTLHFRHVVSKDGVNEDGSRTGRKYAPMAAAITSYARKSLCEVIRAVGDRFCYSDTDSVHMLGDEVPDCVEVDPFKLGAWDREAVFDRARFWGAKAYQEHVDGRWEYTLAGCPAKALEGISCDDFRPETTFHPKLVPKQVPGGVILEDVGYFFEPR